jgi:hypothetical protein
MVAEALSWEVRPAEREAYHSHPVLRLKMLELLSTPQHDIVTWC